MEVPEATLDKRPAVSVANKRLFVHLRHLNAPAEEDRFASLLLAHATSAATATATRVKFKENYQRWHNWAETHSCVPRYFHTPSTELELKEIIHRAREEGEKVKVVGAGHSPTNCAITKGHMVSLEFYNKILSVEGPLVKVQSGIRLKELVEKLAEHKLALSNLGSILDQSIAGAISTGTHGTGINYGSLSSSVVAMEIIDAKGETFYCSEDTRPDLFSAALCSLGALGIISTLTIKCEPLYNLHSTEYPMKLSDLLDNLENDINSAEHFRFWWVPHTDNCFVWKANRTTRKPTPSKTLTDSTLHYIVNRKLYEGLLWAATWRPALLQQINSTYSRLLFSKTLEKVDRYDRIFTFDCLFRQYVSEWALPLSNVRAAVEELQKVIKELNLYVHFSVEFRFVKQDEGTLLSTTHDRDSCYIGNIMYRPYGIDAPGTKEYFRAVERIMTKLGGRPHWAKEFELTSAQLEEMYGGNWKKFQSIRNEMDPDRLFANEYLERVLGP
ncbi:D-arabinono-1,4-lactone oxidase [Balamuthia mandrillaris]